MFQSFEIYFFPKISSTLFTIFETFLLYVFHFFLWLLNICHSEPQFCTDNHHPRLVVQVLGTPWTPEFLVWDGWCTQNSLISNRLFSLKFISSYKLLHFIEESYTNCQSNITLCLILHCVLCFYNISYKEICKQYFLCCTQQQLTLHSLTQYPEPLFHQHRLGVLKHVNSNNNRKEKFIMNEHNSLSELINEWKLKHNYHNAKTGVSK